MGFRYSATERTRWLIGFKNILTYMHEYAKISGNVGLVQRLIYY